MEPVHILLVEDNEGDILLTREAFEEIKPEIRLSVVKDGNEAIDFMNKRGHYEDVPLPQIILLDVNLPKRNGFEVLVYLKSNELFNNIPVIMFSTSSFEKDIRRCYENKGSCFITKPADVNSFQNVIESIVNFWVDTVKLPSA